MESDYLAPMGPDLLMRVQRTFDLAWASFPKRLFEHVEPDTARELLARAVIRSSFDDTIDEQDLARGALRQLLGEG